MMTMKNHMKVLQAKTITTVSYKGYNAFFKLVHTHAK